MECSQRDSYSKSTLVVSEIFDQNEGQLPANPHHKQLPILNFAGPQSARGGEVSQGRVVGIASASQTQPQQGLIHSIFLFSRTSRPHLSPICPQTALIQPSFSLSVGGPVGLPLRVDIYRIRRTTYNLRKDLDL
jgi:hypothetical protein